MFFRPISSLAAIALVLVMLFRDPISAAAQPATPEPVPASECSVVPMTEDQLIDIVANGGSPEPVEADAPSSATPEDADTAEAIIALVRMSVACTNANQPLSSLALFSPHYLAARFSGEGADDLGHLIAALTRDPAPATPEEQLVLISVDQIEMIEDGRVVAIISTSNANGTFVDRIAFIQIDGAWRIDTVLELNPPATPIASN